MKNLELKEMSIIKGGDDFGDGICVGVGFLGVGSLFLSVINPFAGMVLAAATVACAEYELNKL